LALSPQWNGAQVAIAETYNRVGGLIRLLAAQLNMPVAAVLAVFHVESGGVAWKPGQALIRFEVHHFWSSWGAAHPAEFDAHFQFGGHNGVPGRPMDKHKFSVTAGGPFTSPHLNQSTEYAVFNLASQLAGVDIASGCMSIGDCQIMVENFPMLGYPGPQAMVNAFQASENAHVLGFFDFVSANRRRMQED